MLQSRVIVDHLFLGSLSDYLRVHELSTRELFNIISTMAKGLAFLHSDKNIYDPHRINKPAIAHRDFKSKNVLLKQDSNGLLSAVISDFGLGMVQKLRNPFMGHNLCHISYAEIFVFRATFEPGISAKVQTR